MIYPINVQREMQYIRIWKNDPNNIYILKNIIYTINQL